MSDATLHYEVADAIATITLDNPTRKNAFTLDMIDDWADAVRAAAEDDAVRVVILTGAGDAFCSGIDLSVLSQPEERELIKALADFPSMVAGAAGTLEPHRLANWLEKSAALVHTWYHKHHVLNEPPAIMQARLALANATRIVLANALAVLGLSAPERM